MKRFLKVILILAAVFGATGLGLTAGGAAMGATMGDIGALDNGITQILHILDHKDGWDEENSEAAMDGQDEDLGYHAHSIRIRFPSFMILNAAFTSRSILFPHSQ